MKTSNLIISSGKLRRGINAPPLLLYLIQHLQLRKPQHNPLLRLGQIAKMNGRDPIIGATVYFGDFALSEFEV